MSDEKPVLSKEEKHTQLRSLHLLERLKYRELLSICKEEDMPHKGRKLEIIRLLAESLTPQQIREYFAKFRGTEVMIGDHRLVPLHEIIDEKNAKKLLEKLVCKKRDLPKIYDTDPMVLKLAAKPGDIIRIARESETAGEAYYYRLVVRNV